MDPSLLQEALHKHKARRETGFGLEYLRFTDDFRDVPRGTVVIGETVIWGYPHIGRILRLETGLAEQFRSPFWAEEKIDGYNVRIVRLEDRMLAFTRGGFICPFTTDRLPDLLDTALLDAHPDLALCGEVAGPGNPYLVGHPPFVTEDVQLFLFDIMRLGEPGFLPHEEKQALIHSYGLPAAPVYGRFESTQWREIRDLLLRLNEEGREGVVFKEVASPHRRTKYVTSNSSIADIQATVPTMLALPPEYFTNRILRLVLFLDEEGIEHEAQLARRLGAAFLDGLFQAIEQFKREHRVYHTFRCRFRDPANAHRLLKMLKRSGGHPRVMERSLEKEGGYHVLEFDKVYPNITGLLGHLLSGGVVYD